MAKSVYKVPADLNTSTLDSMIALRTKDGVGFAPQPLKVILAYLLSGLGCFWMIMNGFIKYGTLFQKILFAIVWACLTVLLCTYDHTHRMNAFRVVTLITYMQSSARKIMTRMSSNVLPFYTVVGIKQNGIDKKTGLIRFEDGTFGYMYRVVGSASILLFEEDKVAIIDRVDSFYRKLECESECIFMTTKSAQAVYKQVAALKKTYDALEEDDTDLRALLDEQFRVLKNYVGGSFKSIHQYMIVKGDNMEQLRHTKSVLQSEIEGSSLMIKRCVPLGYDDIISALQLIYKGKDGSKS